MCGIAGLINYKKEEARKPLNKMLDLIRHRGPDDRGEWLEHGCALGHVRLSIIDLSESGHQPMECSSTGNIIVFNGEIYNYLELRKELEQKGYRFKTRTDTEVILASYWHWGKECLGRFIGMFAFALYDKKKHGVWLVRDRFGIKPLYYAKTNNGSLVFASEIKALLFGTKVKRGVNLRVIKEFVFDRIIDANEETFFSEVQQIKPGHMAWISIDKPEIKQERYYLLKPLRCEELSGVEILSKIRELIFDAINLRLRSDVPVGTMLSGGLDSSSITCVANTIARKKLHSFSSLVEPSTPENRLIKTVEEFCPTVKHHNKPTASDFFKDLLTLIWHQDEPFADASMYAHFALMRLARKNSVPVILSGQGGDEVFCGYYGYLYAWLGDYLRQGKVKEWLGSIKCVSSWYGQSSNFLFFRSLRHILPASVKNFFLNCRTAKQASILSSEARHSYLKRVYNYSGQKGFRLFYFNHLYNWTLPAFLHYEDRNSMAFGVEARVPFLDHRLVEFIAGLEPSMHFSKGAAKQLLRSSMKGLVPDEVLNQRAKFGFPAPLGDWLFQGESKVKLWLKELAPDVPFLEQKGINKFLNSKEEKDYVFVWRVLVLTLWYHLFISRKINHPSL